MRKNHLKKKRDASIAKRFCFLVYTLCSTAQLFTQHLVTGMYPTWGLHSASVSPPLGPHGAVEPRLLHIAKFVQLQASSSHQSRPQNSSRATDSQQGCAEWNQIELLNLQTKVLIFFFLKWRLNSLVLYFFKWFCLPFQRAL